MKAVLKFKICMACRNDLEAEALGFGNFSRQGAKSQSDTPRRVIPNECKGSKKDFSRWTINSFLRPLRLCGKY
jgi:hypothetical protein